MQSSELPLGYAVPLQKGDRLFEYRANEYRAYEYMANEYRAYEYTFLSTRAYEYRGN